MLRSDDGTPAESRHSPLIALLLCKTTASVRELSNFPYALQGAHSVACPRQEIAGVTEAMPIIRQSYDIYSELLTRHRTNEQAIH